MEWEEGGLIMEGSTAAEPKKSGGSKAIVFLLVGLLIGAAIGVGISMALGGGEEEETSGNYLVDGFKLELFYNSGNIQREMACQILKENLESLNPGKIEISVSGVEWAQYLELRKNGAMPAMFLGWAPDYADPDNYIQPFYHQAGTYASMCGYGNDTLDAMIEDAATELDVDVRADKYKQISMDMYEECIFIWTAQATQFHAEREWIDGWYFNPMHSGLIYYSFDKPDIAPEGAPSDYDPDTFLMATIEGNPESLDPAIGYETAGGEVMQNVYETLLFYNGSSADELVPILATEVPTIDNGGISADGLTYTYNLRADVMFHDGNMMTSEDVRYSIERALAVNDAHGPAWMLGQVLIPDYYDYPQGAYNDTTDAFDAGVPVDVIADAVWAVDADTVQFNLTTPYPAFMYAMCYNVGSVISKAWVGDNYGFTGSDANKLALDMCGTGPYKFVEWLPSDKITMEAFADYHEGEAALTNVIIQQIADASTRILMLKEGDADCAAIPRNMKTQVEGVTGIDVMQGLGTFNVDFLGLNQALNLDALPNPERTDVPTDFFADRYVRLAFAHAFNYNQYIEEGLLGTAIQPNGAIPMGMFGYSADVPVYDYNLDKAGFYLYMAETPVDSDSESSVLSELVARIKF
jgi:ABC-type transport system substrate-binding protein